MAPGLVRNASLADQMPRSNLSRSSRDQGEAREGTEKKRDTTERSDGRGQDAERRHKRVNRDKKDKDLRNSENRLDEEIRSSRGPDNFPDQVASSGFSQFPGQHDGAIAGPNGAAPEHPAMSSYIQDQFPGQFPTQSSAPYRPPLAASEGGPGLAAEYYGDHGQSVAEQPGNRANTPSLIIGAEPHLQPALAVAAPPPEPSASGAVGAAASFFSGEFGEDELTSTHGQSNSSTHATGQTRPDGNFHSTSASVISNTGGAAVGSAASYLIDSQGPSHQQHADPESTIGGAPIEGSDTTSHRPTSQTQDLHYSNTSRPPKPSKQSSQPPSNSMYAVEAVGAAGLAAAAYEHRHHSANHKYSSTPQHSTTSIAQRHRNHGPFGALVNFFKDPEGVAQFEEYSEIIGVCKHCFAPGSSPRDAPRKHIHRRRRSNERYGSSARVDKDNRYYSSENEGRRKNNKSWLATGLAGYGLASLGESLFAEETDFDDTHNVKTGRFSPNGRDGRARRRSRSKERVESGFTGDGISEKKELRDDTSGGLKSTTPSTRSKARLSNSKDRKTGLTEAAIGVAPEDSVILSSSRRWSRSPKRKSVEGKYKSQDLSPERRHQSNRKKRRKRDRGFFGFGNGSSSSSSVDLAYAGTQGKHRSGKMSNGKSKEDKKVEAALLGLGAAAAALALKDGRQGHRKKGVKERVGEKQSKEYDAHGSGQARRSKSSENLDDEIWESAAEDDYESINSDLAYGAPVRRSSRESLSSESSGTKKWDWRWGNTNNRRASSPRRKSSDFTSGSAAAGTAGSGRTGTVVTSQDRRQGNAIDSTSSLPLQYVYPVPTSDPSRFDVGREESVVSSSKPAISSRPDAVPLQHPRPIFPVSAAIYSSQTAYDHSYSAPTGPAVFSQTPHHHPEMSNAWHNTHGASTPDSFPRFEQPADDATRDFRVQRRDTLPARFGQDSISGSMAPRRGMSVKDDSSAVRFNLTAEQEERDRRERRRARKEDKERREAEEQEQIEKDRRVPSKEQLNNNSNSRTKPQVLPEISSKKAWTGPAAAGVIGAAIGAAAATDSSKSEERREARRERRRRERELEDEEETLSKSERRRKQRERDDREAAVKERRRLPNESSGSREYEDQQERTPEKHEMSVWQEAASTKRSSSHEDYGAFFTPIELLNRSSGQAKITSANSDADIDLEQVPQIVTVEPKRVHDLSDSPAFSLPDTDGGIDPQNSSFRWDVPRLRLVEPTPPSTRGSTPIPQPKDASDEGFEESQKEPSSSSSKVKWGDNQTHEYTVISPNEDRDEFMEQPIEKISGTDLVDLSRSTHERGVPRHEVHPHNGSTMKTNSPSYGDDAEFAATLAASAEDAGFDPSIVIDNPTYRRRDSPPGSKERSMPGAFDDETGPRFDKKERNRKNKASKRQNLKDSLDERDKDAIVQDIIRQVREPEYQPVRQVLSENLDGEWESIKTSKSKKSKKVRKGSESRDESFQTPELAAKALELESRDMYKSPIEDIASIVSIDTEAERARKPPNDSKRDGTGFDYDAASIVTPSSTTEASKDPRSRPKPKNKRKGSLWDLVRGKSSGSVPQESAKDITDEAILMGSEEPNRKSKESKGRKSAHEGDEDYDSKGGSNIGGTTPQGSGRISQDLPVKVYTAVPSGHALPNEVLTIYQIRATSLPSTSSDAGAGAQHLDYGIEREHAEKKQPKSFLEKGPEPPPPPDTHVESEELPGPYKTTSLPTSPHTETEPQSRRFSDAEISNPTQTTAALPSSPTAIPFHFRQPGRSPSTARSVSQTPSSELISAADLIPRQKARPRSTEFKSSKEIRPLWLVERHRSHQEPTPDEKYPSLPSSHTTSRSSSVHDLDGSRPRGWKDDESNEAEQEPMKVESALMISTDSLPIRSDLLDSQQATPTASSFQDLRTIHDLPSSQASKVSSPKVNAAGNPHKSPSTLKSGVLSAILGGSAAIALTGAIQNNDPSPQDLTREEKENFEHDLDDMDLDTVTHPSYNNTLDQEDFIPQKTKKGKRNKWKAGQSKEEEIETSLAGAMEAKPKTSIVDPEPLSPEDMRQIQEQDAQDAVDSWFPPVLHSNRGKKGKRGKGKAFNERLSKETGPSPYTHEPPSDIIEIAVPAEGQKRDSPTLEMSREQIVDIMTATAQDSSKDENEASQSATAPSQEASEARAEEIRSESKGSEIKKDGKSLPQDRLPQVDLRTRDLPQDEVLPEDFPQDDLVQDNLQTNSLSLEESLRESLSQDDLGQDNISQSDLPQTTLTKYDVPHYERSQFAIQQRTDPEGDFPQFNVPRDDSSQLQDPQDRILQGDHPPDSLLALSSSAPMKISFVDPFLEHSHEKLLESPKAYAASQELGRGGLITAISPPLELSPRATSLTHDDKDELLDGRLGNPVSPTSLDQFDDKEMEVAAEQPSNVSQIRFSSTVTPEPLYQSQDLPSRAKQVDADDDFAPAKKKSKKNRKAKQNLTVAANENADIQQKVEPLLTVAPIMPEDDRPKDMNEALAMEVPWEKSGSVEHEWRGFINNNKGKKGKKARQGSPVENSKTIDIRERQVSLSNTATSEVPGYQEAMKSIEEPAIHVSQSKAEALENERESFDSNEKKGRFEKQRSKTLDLEAEPDETEHQVKRQSDARDEMNDCSSSLATTRTSQEVSAMLGLGETEASIGGESKGPFPSDSQAEHSLQKGSEDLRSGSDERNTPITHEREAPQFGDTPGRANDDNTFRTLGTSVASTNAPQAVQDILARESNAESVADAKREGMVASTSMEQTAFDTPIKNNELDWDASKKKKKGKKGKNNEISSWDETEMIEPAEGSGPPVASNTPLEEESAADKPIEEDVQDWEAPKRMKKTKKGKKTEVFLFDESKITESAKVSGPPGAPKTPLEEDSAVNKPIEDNVQDWEAPKGKKKAKKGKKTEVFLWDEPKIMEPAEVLDPPDAVNSLFLEQEPVVKVIDEVSSKQSKKDKKGKKGKRKGSSRAVSGFRDEDEPNVASTEGPRDEHKAEDLPAIAGGVQEEFEPSRIHTEIPQDDDKVEGLHAVSYRLRKNAEPSIVPTEDLQDDDQLENRSAVGRPLIIGDVLEGLEQSVVSTEAPKDDDKVYDPPADSMSRMRAELSAPGKELEPAVPAENARGYQNEESQEALLEQEQDFTPSKGKKGQKKSKKSKSSPRSLGDIPSTLREKNGTEQVNSSDVDVIDESERIVPKQKPEQEADFMLPMNKGDKMMSKKFSTFSPDSDDFPAVEDEPMFKTQDLEKEALRQTPRSAVDLLKEPETFVEGLPEEKKDQEETEEAQPLEWKEEGITAQSEQKAAQELNKEPEADSNINPLDASGNFVMTEGKREEPAQRYSDFVPAHANASEVPYKASLSVKPSLEQPADVSEQTTACEADQSNGNLVPAVGTNNPLHSLKPSKKNQKKAKMARSLTWEEEKGSQEPRSVLEESSATADPGEPTNVPVSQENKFWLKPETSAQKTEYKEIVQPSMTSKVDQGYHQSVLDERTSDARNEIHRMVEVEREESFANTKRDKEDQRTEDEELFIPQHRSAADEQELVSAAATSPIRGSEQTSEQQPRYGFNTAGEIGSNQEEPVGELKGQEDPDLMEPGAIEEAKDEDTRWNAPVQRAEKPEIQQDEAQWVEPRTEKLSPSATPEPTREIVGTVRNTGDVTNVEPLGSLGKDAPIPAVNIEMLEAQGQRNFNEKYVKEFEQTVLNTEPVADLEPSEGFRIDKPIPTLEVEMSDAQGQRDYYNEKYAKEFEQAVPNTEPVADLAPSEGSRIDKPIPALEIEMSDAQEQHDYNEEYAKELERQLSPLQEGERADPSRDEDNAPMFSQSSSNPVMERPYEDEHRPLAQPPALDDIIEESRSTPGSVQGSPIDRKDDFSPFDSIQKSKNGKEGKKQQPVNLEDEVSVTPADPENNHGAELSFQYSEGPESSENDAARLLNLEEPIKQRSLEDRTIASSTVDFNIADNESSGDYFAIQPSRPAEEDVGMEDTHEFRRALSTEPSYFTREGSPAQELQTVQGDHSRENAVRDEERGSLAKNFFDVSIPEAEPAEGRVEYDLDTAPAPSTERRNDSEKNASAINPSAQAQEQEDLVDQTQDLKFSTTDTLNARSPSPQNSSESPSHDEAELVSGFDGRPTSRGRSRTMKGAAAVAGLGLGTLAAESLSTIGSKKEGRRSKVKEGGRWTSFEDDISEPKNSIEKGDKAFKKQEHCQTPESEKSVRVEQHHEGTPPRSPPANYGVNADHPRVEDLGQSLEMPEYRDSAIYVSGSPTVSEELPYHRAVRDSGYPDTEASPFIDDELKTPDNMKESERDITVGEKLEDVHHRHSRAHETDEHQRSLSRNRLEISVDAESDYDVSDTNPKERQKGSTRKSGAAYDSDDSADSGFDIQRRRRRQATTAEPREPSPLNSTTKDKSSALFDSSPSARDETVAKLQDQHVSPRYDPVGEAPSWSFGREQSPPHRSQEAPREGRPVNVPERALESTGYDISVGNHEDSSRSLFGGPQNFEDELVSPSRSPHSSGSRGHRGLDTISEDRVEGSPLHKKDKRAASDVGSPESGVKGRRMRSPSVEDDAVGEYVSNHESISPQTWPAADEEKGAVEEGSRSGNSDQLSSFSSRHSALASVTSRQREEEYRTASAASMRSEKSIHAIILTPDQVRPASGLTYPSSATPPPPLRRVDRSASGDLRGAKKKTEAKSRAKTSSEFEAEADIGIPSSSTYDPLTDKGKSRADMADVYVSFLLNLSTLNPSL